MKPRKLSYLLLTLLNLLSDFDGEISEQAASVLAQIKQCSAPVPPLYADVFNLPASTTCAEFAEFVASLPQKQLATASYAFQVFRSYEQMLRVDTTEMSPKQRAASEAQMEQIRLLIARTKQVMAEAIVEKDSK